MGRNSTRQQRPTNSSSLMNLESSCHSHSTHQRSASHNYASSSPVRVQRHSSMESITGSLLPSGQSVSSLYLQCVSNSGYHSPYHQELLNLCSYATEPKPSSKKNSGRKTKQRKQLLLSCSPKKRSSNHQQGFYKRNSFQNIENRSRNEFENVDKLEDTKMQSDSAQSDDDDSSCNMWDDIYCNEISGDFYDYARNVNLTNDSDDVPKEESCSISSVTESSDEEKQNRVNRSAIRQQLRKQYEPNVIRQKKVTTQAKTNSILFSPNSLGHRCFPIPLHFEFRHWIAENAKVTKSELVHQLKKFQKKRRPLRNDILRLPLFFKGLPLTPLIGNYPSRLKALLPRAVSLTANGMIATFNKKIQHGELTTVKADRPIPTTALIYYFEVTILRPDSFSSSPSNPPKIIVGLSVERSGGGDRGIEGDNTFMGYHSEDGHVVFSTQSSDSFGPPYQHGDVIGCGINFAARAVFFTKNGAIVGSQLPIPEPPHVLSARQSTHHSSNFKEPQGTDFYPAVSLGSSGDRIQINFGCPRCYWLLDGSCGMQLFSPLRMKQLGDVEGYNTSSDDVVETVKPQLSKRTTLGSRETNKVNWIDTCLTSLKNSSCVCLFLGLQPSWNEKPPQCFVYDIEPLLELEFNTHREAVLSTEIHQLDNQASSEHRSTTYLDLERTSNLRHSGTPLPTPTEAPSSSSCLSLPSPLSTSLQSHVFSGTTSTEILTSSAFVTTPYPQRPMPGSVPGPPPSRIQVRPRGDEEGFPILPHAITVFDRSGLFPIVQERGPLQPVLSPTAPSPRMFEAAITNPSIQSSDEQVQNDLAEPPRIRLPVHQPQITAEQSPQESTNEPENVPQEHEISEPEWEQASRIQDTPPLSDSVQRSSGLSVISGSYVDTTIPISQQSSRRQEESTLAPNRTLDISNPRYLDSMSFLNPSVLHGLGESGKLWATAFTSTDIPQPATHPMTTCSFDQNTGYFRSGSLDLDDLVRLFLLHSGYVTTLSAFDKGRMHRAKSSRSLANSTLSRSPHHESARTELNNSNLSSDAVVTPMERMDKNGMTNGNSRTFTRESLQQVLSTEVTDEGRTKIQCRYKCYWKFLRDIRSQVKVCEETLGKTDANSLSKGDSPHNARNISMVADRDRIRKLVAQHIHNLCRTLIDEGPKSASSLEIQNIKGRSKPEIWKNPQKRKANQGITKGPTKDEQEQDRQVPYFWWNDHKQFGYENCRAHCSDGVKDHKNDLDTSGVSESSSSISLETVKTNQYAFPDPSQRYLLWPQHYGEKERNSFIQNSCLDLNSVSNDLAKNCIPLTADNVYSNLRHQPTHLGYPLPRLTMSGCALLFPPIGVALPFKTHVHTPTLDVFDINIEGSLSNGDSMRSNTSEKPKSNLAQYLNYCISDVPHGDINQNSYKMNLKLNNLVMDLSLEESLERARMFGRYFMADRAEIVRQCPAVSCQALQTLHRSGLLRKELRHLILNGYILEVIEFCRVFIPSIFTETPVDPAIGFLLTQQLIELLRPSQHDSVEDLSAEWIVLAFYLFLHVCIEFELPSDLQHSVTALRTSLLERIKNDICKYQEGLNNCKGLRSPLLYFSEEVLRPSPSLSHPSQGQLNKPEYKSYDSDKEIGSTDITLWWMREVLGPMLPRLSEGGRAQFIDVCGLICEGPSQRRSPLFSYHRRSQTADLFNRYLLYGHFGVIAESSLELLMKHLVAARHTLRDYHYHSGPVVSARSLIFFGKQVTLGAVLKSPKERFNIKSTGKAFSTIGEVEDLWSMIEKRHQCSKLSTLYDSLLAKNSRKPLPSMGNRPPLLMSSSYDSMMMKSSTIKRLPITAYSAFRDERNNCQRPELVMCPLDDDDSGDEN